MSGETPPRTPIYIAPAGVVERRRTDALAVEHPGVIAALRFIHDHAHHELRMKYILKHVAMSRSGLEKAFREQFVRSPMDHVRHVRLSGAMHLLRATDEKILAIARQSGFQTPHNLCRSFQQLLNMTPGQYRRNERETPKPPGRLGVSFARHRSGFRQLRSTRQADAGRPVRRWSLGCSIRRGMPLQLSLQGS